MLYLIVLAGLALLAPPSPAPSAALRNTAAVEVTLGSFVSVAPAFVRVHVKVPRHPDNRSLEVVVESAEYLAGSEVELDGEAAALIHEFHYSHLPAGLYDVTARLGRNDGSDAVDRLQFEVVGRTPRDGPLQP